LSSETYESIFAHLVGFLGRGISLSQGHYPHRTTQHKKCGHTFMPRAGFETTMPVSYINFNTYLYSV